MRVHLDEQLQRGTGGRDRCAGTAERRELGALDVDLDDRGAMPCSAQNRSIDTALTSLVFIAGASRAARAG